MPQKIDTAIANTVKSDEPGPLSVIHAPQEFKHFSSDETPTAERPTESPSQQSEQSDNTVVSPDSPKARLSAETRRDSTTSPINTDVPSVKVIDRSTPHAQTRQEAEEEWKRRSKHNLSLEDIPEGQDHERSNDEETPSEAQEEFPRYQQLSGEQQAQIDALRTALGECWTLCNTLASLSSNHRTHIFAYRGKSQVQEYAWRSCWRLCQNLYDNRDEDHTGMILPTLEMCRDFCQALFEARQRGNEAADSVLRVSFELNNHLYNTHDRNLPSAFQERTLDFYVTLCHRLMKQRTSLPHETDALLRACWSLAEMLFSIRQNKRDGKPPDEELFGSAVQACWELCDLFREGWTQVRPGPERVTPRATQGSFSQSQSSIRSTSIFSSRSSPSYTRAATYQGGPKAFPPETPTTIFDDPNESPLGSEDGQHIPNIMVLGPEQSSSSMANSAYPQSSHGRTRNHNRWPSSASAISSISSTSRTSHHTSSTATAPGAASTPEANLARIRLLLLKAATNAGFQIRRSPAPSTPSGSPPTTADTNSRPNSSSTNASSATSTSTQNAKQTQYSHALAQNQALLTFVKSLPKNTFGPSARQAVILDKYRRLVAAWPALVASGTASSAASVNGTTTASTAGSSTVLGNGTSEANGMPNGININGTTTSGEAPSNPDEAEAGAAMTTLLITPPSAHRRANTADVARAVLWMMRSEKNVWMGELFRIVFGVGVGEVVRDGFPAAGGEGLGVMVG